MLRFKRAVIATGARAVEPPIPGLVGYLTNETVFNLTQCPARLAVIGGGPIGCELAQAFQRLGSQVTLISSRERVLPHEDAVAAMVLEDVFRRRGMMVLSRSRAAAVSTGRTPVALGAINPTTPISAQAATSRMTGSGNGARPV